MRLQKGSVRGLSIRRLCEIKLFSAYCIRLDYSSVANCVLFSKFPSSSLFVAHHQPTLKRSRSSIFLVVVSSFSLSLIMSFQQTPRLRSIMYELEPAPMDQVNEEELKYMLNLPNATGIENGMERAFAWQWSEFWGRFVLVPRLEKFRGMY